MMHIAAGVFLGLMAYAAWGEWSQDWAQNRQFKKDMRARRNQQPIAKPKPGLPAPPASLPWPVPRVASEPISKPWNLWRVLSVTWMALVVAGICMLFQYLLAIH